MKQENWIMLLMGVLIVLACNRGPYATTNKAIKKRQNAWQNKSVKPLENKLRQRAPQWVGTTNFNLRKPNLVIIHHTAQNSCEQTLKTFTLPRTSVSAHYVICKDGIIHHMLNDY
jgi:N-acetylmuramoyl-L-alanine amidase